MKSNQNLPLLYGSATSPFARMTKIYGELLGINFNYKDIDIYNAEFIDEHNPLRQVPTMVMGDFAIFDSRTIFRYFENLANRNVKDENFQQATRISLALGMADACLQYRMEMMLPEDEQNEARILKLKARMNRSLERLEAWAGLISAGEVRLEQIVIACALEYVDFRYTSDWRINCATLDVWMRQFSERNDMQQTRPVS